MGRRKSEVQQAAAHELDGIGVATETRVGGVWRISRHVSLRWSVLYPCSIVVLLYIHASAESYESPHINLIDRSVLTR